MRVSRLVQQTYIFTHTNQRRKYTRGFYSRDEFIHPAKWLSCQCADFFFYPFLLIKLTLNYDSKADEAERQRVEEID